MSELQKAIEAKLLAEILEACSGKRQELICQYETFAHAVAVLAVHKH